MATTMNVAPPPPGLWVGASFALGRDVATDEPYPHICHIDVVGRMTGARYRLTWRECAACYEKRARS